MSRCLNQAEAKRLLDYNPDTGELRWRVTRGKVLAGSLAGSLNGRGYRNVGLGHKLYRAHRIIWLWMTGDWPAQEVDHINHARDDNRWTNLRDVSKATNGKNQRQSGRNVSGFTGVGWHKRSRKWRARITVNGRRIWLGVFVNKLDAIKAREAADLKYNFHTNHGEPK